MRKDYSFFLIPCDEHGQPIANQKLFDVELNFHAQYRSMTGLGDYGEVKNAYTEDYAEDSILRTYFPPSAEITHKSTTHELTLYFSGENSFNNSVYFERMVMGRRFLWYDNFRHNFAMVALCKQPKTNREKLYGAQQYRDMTYTFDDLAGGTSDMVPIEDRTMDNVHVGDFICQMDIEPSSGDVSFSTADYLLVLEDNTEVRVTAKGLQIHHPLTANSVPILDNKGHEVNIPYELQRRYVNLVCGVVKRVVKTNLPDIIRNCVMFSALKV